MANNFNLENFEMLSQFLASQSSSNNSETVLEEEGTESQKVIC